MSSRRSWVPMAALLAVAGCTTEFPLELLDAQRPGADGGPLDARTEDDSGPPDARADDDAGPDAQIERRCPEARLVEGTAVTTPGPAGAVPARGVQLRDPSFDTCVTRISDARIDADASSYVNPVLRGSVSADRALLLMGSYQFHLFDLGARTHVMPLTFYSGDFARLAGDGDASFFWLDPPFEIVHTSLAGAEIARVDLSAAIYASVAGASEIGAIHPYSPSADDSVWALPVTTSSGRAVVTVELAAGTVLGARTLASTQKMRVGTSPSGAFVAIVYAQEDPGPITALDVYTRDLATQRFTLDGGAGAWDFARGPDGRDVLVYSQGQHLMRLDLEVAGAAPVVVMDELSDSPLSPMRAASDVVISGAAYDRPGWVVVSFANCRLAGGVACEPGRIWAQDRIALVSLADGRVVNLAWHRSTRGGSRHPHALPSRDLSRVVFDSDWADSGAPVEAYVIDLPATL